MSNGLAWWGYIHTNGSIQVKRYFSQEDLAEAWESPFVARVHGPFDANGRDDAIKIIKRMEGRDE